MICLLNDVFMQLCFMLFDVTSRKAGWTIIPRLYGAVQEALGVFSCVVLGWNKFASVGLSVVCCGEML